MKKILFILAIAALLLASCAAATQSPSYEYDRGEAPPAMPEAAEEGAGGLNSQIPEQKRIVITNASLELAVDDPSASMERIRGLAEEMDGFVVSARLSQVTLASGAEVPQASITIRVPAELLEEALAAIRAETTRPVIFENIDSQDVTKDYTDLQSRLRNLEAAEEQLTEIMASATRTEDVLSVYDELTRVREQIEVIQGQIQYYEQSAALSAISVELKANEAVQPLTIGGWQPAGIAKDALQALINGLKILGTIAIWVIVFFIPILVVIFLPLFFIIRIFLAWRKRGLKKTPPPAPAG